VNSCLDFPLSFHFFFPFFPTRIAKFLKNSKPKKHVGWGRGDNPTIKNQNSPN
jgi:hypothetical protein